MHNLLHTSTHITANTQFITTVTKAYYRQAAVATVATVEESLILNRDFMTILQEHHKAKSHFYLQELLFTVSL